MRFHLVTPRARARFNSAAEAMLLSVCLAGASAIFFVGVRPVSAYLAAERVPGQPHADSPNLLVPDKGKFQIIVNGQEIGQEQFEISPSGTTWIASGASEIHSAKGVGHVTGKLVLHTDGTPVKYDWSTQGDKKASASLAFNGPVVIIELHLDGARPYTQQLTFSSPQVIVLDNNLYYQYAILARLYDWNKKGAQTFSVLVPQEMTPGSVTVDSLGKQDMNGKQLDELQVKTEDIELDLYVDSGRLVRIVSPSANAQIIRE